MHCPWVSLLGYDSEESIFGCFGVALTVKALFGIYDRRDSVFLGVEVLE